MPNFSIHWNVNFFYRRLTKTSWKQTRRFKMDFGRFGYLKSVTSAVKCLRMWFKNSESQERKTLKVALTTQKWHYWTHLLSTNIFLVILARNLNFLLLILSIEISLCLSTFDNLRSTFWVVTYLSSTKVLNPTRKSFFILHAVWIH